LIRIKNIEKFKITFLILSILTSSSILLNSFLFFPENGIDKVDNGYNDSDFQTTDIIAHPKSSYFGNAPWWSESFEYRKVINITNPYMSSFKDFGVSFSFNYYELVENGKLQGDLDDIRIIENGCLRKYYVVKDYPLSNQATVFFETNISQNTVETDTYMYFGNPTASNLESSDPEDSFGWIKNGNFELDINLSDKFVPYGWSFSHNPVDQIMDHANPNPNPYNSSDTSIQFFVNKLINNPQGAERVAQGTYTYKFGALSPTLPDGAVNDYASTFFSYPFKVPTVEGGISLTFYRNIRTYRFERPKNMGDINQDGYFIRILNGSISHYDINPDNHDDNAISISFENYVESYDGYGYYNVPAKKWSDPTVLIDYPSHLTTKDTLSDTGNDGNLTGYVEFDLSNYMGKDIFFEIGVWGDESNVDRKEKSAFFQLDDLKFNYTLTASINEIQARKSNITIITRDVDGRIVPNTKIFLLNETAKGTPNYIVNTGYTSELDGSITFNNVLNGEYNITANYTLGPRERFVGNKLKQLNGTNYLVELSINIWTIDFEIVDWDKIPMNYGYIEINESFGGPMLKNMTLNNEGKATFRWLNQSEYYFKVYYKNRDYRNGTFILSESYITRQEYNNERFKNQSFVVSNINKANAGEERYLVQERIYTNGSRTEIGNKMLIKANITLLNMNSRLKNISVYYIDKYNSTGVGNENLIFFKNYYGFNEDNDFIKIDLPLSDNIKLKSEKFQVYGLYVVINGENSSQCDGIVSFDFLETCNVFNQTNLSRLSIRVINKNELSPAGSPVDSIVKVHDNMTGDLIVSLLSDENRNGYAFGQINDIPFWFFKDRVYNFSIDIVNITNSYFNITLMTPENQWKPVDNIGIQYYNYSFYGKAAITFNIILEQTINITNYDTALVNASGSLEVFWSEQITYSIIFEYTQDNGNSWYAVTNPTAYCSLSIKQVGSEVNLIEVIMSRGLGDGNFTSTMNSSFLSAGVSSKYYIVKITGLFPGYPEPNSISFILRINSIPTAISVHDYNTKIERIDKSFTKYFNELINISIKLSVFESGSSLYGALVTYTWIGLEPIEILEDHLNNDYYTFTINSSRALSTGVKIISISTLIENYSSQTNFLIYLNILERRTELNGEENLLYLNPKVLVQDAKNFIFTYRDVNSQEIIGDLTVASYTWQELYENGTIIPGRDGIGSLTQNANKSYSLDFNTEFKNIGFYFLYITLQKENYESKFALINLEIILRDFTAEVFLDDLHRTQINLIHGTDLEFEIVINDSSRGNIPLQNAIVVLKLGDYQYNFNETSPGVYMYIFETENIETFFAPRLLAGTILIQKSNFTSQETRINISIQMEEIFPGMPTFYFILLISAIIGIAGSLTIYRVVQQARIPKFIKKVRKVKAVIKSNKPIRDSLLTKTKEQMMINLYNEDWKSLEISLESILDIEEKRPKELIKKDKKPPEEVK